MISIKKTGKGQVDVGFIIKGIIALGVLAIAGIIIYLYFFGGTGIPFFKNLPSFNNTKERIENIQILRYDIANDQAAYYDGTRYVVFQESGAIEMSNKHVSYQDALTVFERLYFPEPVRGGKAFDLGNGLRLYLLYIVDTPDKIPGGPLDIGSQKLNRGDAICTLALNGNNIGYYLVGLDGKTTYLKITSDEPAGITGKVVSSANLWRDDVLKTPILIKYTDIKTHLGATANVCASKSPDGKYLVADLSNEQRSCP